MKRTPLFFLSTTLSTALLAGTIGGQLAQADEAMVDGVTETGRASASAAPTLQAPLPPALPWSGASEELLKNIPAEWLTPIEQSQFVGTPNYDDTLTFLRRLDLQSELIQLQEFGRSAEGRPLVLVIASKNPEPLLNRRLKSPAARVLMQAGIHAGEIDGKDAGLMLLRDFALGKQLQLIDNADLYFVPVFNVDGHERRGGSSDGRPSNQRVNQRGPEQMGWRTTAQNLNLNRDYMKAESPEMQAMLRLLQRLDPELYLDLHVTDGIDYQYDITFGSNDRNAYSPRIARWLREQYRPGLDKALKKQGHIPGPLIFANANKDLSQGISDWQASPRFSQGYGDLRHLPAMLVENHSLKPYKQRVLGTYVLMAATLELAGKNVASLRTAIAADRQQRAETLGFVPTADTANSYKMKFAGVAHENYQSPISGDTEVRWLGQPQEFDVDVIPSQPSVLVTRPKAYWLPATASNAIAVLRRHGIQLEEIKQPTTRQLEWYRLPDAKQQPKAFEGRALVSSGQPVIETHERTFPAGSVRVSTDQPLGELVVALLEPQSEDSLFSWGYFLEILSATEYIEGYVVEPLAQQMLQQNPALQEAFNKALQDENFAKDPEARLRWFYQRSGYADPEYLLYPVAVER
ncbi:carboxypeptidase [Permianibacter sp. IMCC34836]|uniref:M14 family metallopeptidase n=1 Tax=Permianibacter fluminis TaxID=2738515 RepID=UPI0015530D44|nr:M14 family metallopeptidase [Permianibacter fluminis]NQD38540.1 carboxypeptidase [Permianibacter fluminis]